jgi:hypothetical protein
MQSAKYGRQLPEDQILGRARVGHKWFALRVHGDIE